MPPSDLPKFVHYAIYSKDGTVSLGSFGYGCDLTGLVKISDEEVPFVITFYYDLNRIFPTNLTLCGRFRLADQTLWPFATNREWHLYKHGKRRVRKKYYNRLQRRAMRDLFRRLAE